MMYNRVFYNIIESEKTIDKLFNKWESVHHIKGNFIIYDKIVGTFHVCNNVISIDMKINDLIIQHQDINNKYHVELTKYIYNNDKKIIYIIDKMS